MKLPSFSIVIESANLAVADLDGLQATLQSLVQNPGIHRACEVVLVDSGDVPETVMVETLARYPWLQTRRLPPGTGYEELKTAGVQATTGEIVIMADGDCVYEKDWLEALLSPFTDRSVHIVGGHTEIRSDGPYGLGVMIAFSFASRDAAGLHETTRYHMNNVAFRREVLERVPIPARLPCYRMTGVHTARLQDAGYTVWRQPGARAIHAAPNGFSHFAWRFVLFGHDAWIVPRLIRQERARFGGAPDRSRRLPVMLWTWVTQSGAKASAEIRQRPRRAIELPFALAVFGGAVFFQIVGLVGAMLWSRTVLRWVPEDIRRASTSQT